MNPVKALYKLMECAPRADNTRFVQGLSEAMQIHINTNMDLEVVLEITCGLQVFEDCIV